MEQEQSEKKKGIPADHLANERTFLAWIRTSIAVMAFGFVVVKFALFANQIAFFISENHDGIVLPNKNYSSILGIILVTTGVFMTFLSYIKYRKTEKQLLTNSFSSASKISVLFAFIIILVGVLLVVYLVQSV